MHFVIKRMLRPNKSKEEAGLTLGKLLELEVKLPPGATFCSLHRFSSAVTVVKVRRMNTIQQFPPPDLP